MVNGIRSRYLYSLEKYKQEENNQMLIPIKVSTAEYLGVTMIPGYRGKSIFMKFVAKLTK